MAVAKSDAANLKKMVAFRLTERDFEAYRKKFVASGLSQSQFFRDHVLTNSTEVVAAKPGSLEAKKMLYLLAKISNNINQLAHRVNADHLERKASELTYSAILSNLEAITTHLSVIVKNVD